MHVAHLLHGQHRACAYQYFGVGGSHVGNALQRLGRVQRYFPQAKACGVQRGTHVDGFTRLQAAQNGDQRQLGLQGLEAVNQSHAVVFVRWS